MKKTKWAPKNLYEQFQVYFPFVTVDIVIHHEKSFILIKRKISPYKNKWHLPGGIVKKQEKLREVVRRVVNDEVNLDAKIETFLGTYENPIRTRHDISHCFVAKIKDRKIPLNSKTVKFFTKIPTNIIPYHVKMLEDAQPYLK